MAKSRTAMFELSLCGTVGVKLVLLAPHNSSGPFTGFGLASPESSHIAIFLTLAMPLEGWTIILPALSLDGDIAREGSVLLWPYRKLMVESHPEPGCQLGNFCSCLPSGCILPCQRMTFASSPL